MISTIETFYQQFKHEEADGLKFWGPGILHWVILDEAQRLGMSGTPIGKFRKANGTSVKMDSRNYNMHIAFCILSIKPQYQWMLTATPLVNGIEDWHLIQPFVESSS